jgi:hypothetical protein
VNRSGRPGDGRHSERPCASALFEIAITKYPGRACLACMAMQAVLATTTARSGRQDLCVQPSFVSLALALTTWRSPGSSEKLCPAS